MKPRPEDFLGAARAMAGDLSPEARAAIAAAWPAESPHPAVVAHLLAVMLADVRAAVSSGFIRAAVPRAPSKRPPPAVGLAKELEDPKQPASNPA